MSDLTVETSDTVKTRTRISALDGVRALAISFVLCAHGVQTHLTDALGSLGVSLFFVLSGYLITSLLVNELERDGSIDLRKFYGRRIRRIFPAYYVYLSLIAIATLFGLIHIDPRSFVYDIFYLKNYAFNVPMDWWTGHAWTLCIEEQFYLIWPAVLVLGGMRFGLRFAVACLVAAPVLRILAYVALPHYRDFIDVMLPTRIDMIMFGCTLAIAAAHGVAFVVSVTQRRLEVILGILFVAVVAGLMLTMRFRGLYVFPIGYTLTGIAAASLILYVVRFPTAITARIFSVPPVTWLGRISYSLYLWQQPFLTPGLNNSFTGRFPINLTAALVLAILSYYFVERRFFVPAPLRANVSTNSQSKLL